MLGTFIPILLPRESLVMLAFAFVPFADGRSVEQMRRYIALRPSGISPTFMKRMVLVPSEAGMPPGECLAQAGRSPQCSCVPRAGRRSS
jgi:hypothetical protein